jgi:hypothetical protein
VQQHVASRGQLNEAPPLRLALQVQDNAALVRVEEEEEAAALQMRLVVWERALPPRAVACWRLYLNDISAQVRFPA